MTESMKRIHKVVVKRMYDEDPDTSWMGEYSNKPESKYAIDRAHDEDCQSQRFNHKDIVNKLERIIDYLGVERTIEGEKELSTLWESLDEAIDILIQAQNDAEECDCGRSGQWSGREYRYFNGPVDNYKGESDEDIRKYVRQDYERMESLQRGDWGFIGIRAEAEYYVATKARVATGEHGTFLMQTVSSGGLWGIESDSDKSYFAEVEKEELAELRRQLEGIGFSKRAVSAAFKNIEREGDAQ